MSRQSTTPDREAFDKTSEGARKAHCLLQFPCSGNRQALNDLFASSNSRLYQTAFRILSNPHDAEDAVQDGLLCAFRNLDKFRGSAKFSTWLHRIAINSSLMRLRKRKYRREYPLEPVFTGEEPVATGIVDLRSDDLNPEEQCARVEQRKILSEALLKLPDTFRTAIELCHLEGLSVKEAAQRLGVPLSTMKARLFRSRRALKTMILRRRSARSSFRGADKNFCWQRPEVEAREMEPLTAA